MSKTAQKYKRKDTFSTRPTDVRIPARLNSPLIPYPEEIKQLCLGTYAGDPDKIHGHHSSQIDTLREVIFACQKEGTLPKRKVYFDVVHLKRFARQKFSTRENLINLATLSFAKRATAHDLSIAAGESIPFAAPTVSISQYTSFIIMIQRLRVHISKENEFPAFTAKHRIGYQDQAEYVMFSNGVYWYSSRIQGWEYHILSCGGHFAMYHSDLDYWFYGPTSYLDYVFTIADILNNLDVLMNCDEYQWACDMFRILIEFCEHEGFHNDQVDFMKGLEGFFLNLSDYDESFAMNWKPILIAVEDLWQLDQRISSINYDLCLPLALMRKKSFYFPKESFLCRFIDCAMKLSRTHLQEVSSLHKLIFYAEVDARAGVEKFLKRVHTKRPMDKNAVKNLTRLAKCQFLVAYTQRHKTVPAMLGNDAKITLLKLYMEQSDNTRVEALPLSWWDDVQIFDCMDNTLTDDPLEFAKDKGALKSQISYGPGDSRKELLQVIEKQDYILKDFFETKTIRPKTPRVFETTQLEEPISISDPARLIEKEKEQKWAARLFANGELSNKHALSLIAARMKKALSYFTEQLMTPSDKKRKSLIHEAARELSQPDNYSLLLDIEGHNQSMQYDNTHELAEFLGNLFGQSGWGDISHYFSYLTVYHYDEYLDKVIVSEGQYGGIEGWLNPFWTLHTTLMMKLLRIMTDIDVNTIMVYSDDVNAIVKIPQSSEMMVQSVFSKIMKHCTKFGMTVKYSQTNLSKHRITMLRQHYADGVRADSTLKRLISVSAGNNPTLVTDEVEVSGICSSASSAMELSNHHEACSYLKNYKLGLLLSRLPNMVMGRDVKDSVLSHDQLPVGISNLLYYQKQEQEILDLRKREDLNAAAMNDIAKYLDRQGITLTKENVKTTIGSLYGTSVAESRILDNADRLLYLQIYDKFIQDLLFYWIYLPTSLGGLGGSLHINLMLSGHSIGFTKSLQYLFQWIQNGASEQAYFRKYLSVSLSISQDNEKNYDETRVVTNPWPNDHRICSATTSIQQSIKSMVRRLTKNRLVLQMFEMSDDRQGLAEELLEIFRSNFHSRIVQFYHENTSVHFIDLLISKIETSSGLLTKVKNITRLRNSLSQRAVENIRLGASTSRTLYGELQPNTDLVDFLLSRKISMFPKIAFIQVEEILYDDKLMEVELRNALLTVRRCAPTHYRNGIRVYDDPKVGSEVLYKGELLDNDRMLANKEELLAAKLVAVTKWMIMKNNLMLLPPAELLSLDMVKACNLSLGTLTNQTFSDLFHFAPTEVGGEILHRIPNIRFNSATSIRSEMNRSLNYTSELNQRLISDLGLVDSNVNFDYMRLRFIVAAIVMDKYDTKRRLVMRYGFKRLTGVHDVQFVCPVHSQHAVGRKFKCYSDMKGHKISMMRFRYLSHSFLHEENVNDWALIPKLHDVESAKEVGKNFVEDLILRYSRDLDKDYMLISPTQIEKGVWSPLIEKLYRIDSKWKLNENLSDIEEIGIRLTSVLQKRNRITTIDKSQRVTLSMQSQCFELIRENAPRDSEYTSLVSRYMMVARNRRHSGNLTIRLSQYQAMLSSLSEHRFALAKTLLHEYLATFHFAVIQEGDNLVVNNAHISEKFLSVGLSKLSMLAIEPDLQTRMMILGYEYLDMVIRVHWDEVMESFREITELVSCADIIVPEGLPSISSYTALTGNEPLPPGIEEVEYESESISLSTMRTLHHGEALFTYAHRCSTIGAHPLVFTSHTGSDSLSAQYALFKHLMKEGILDTGMRICDLTAGRGDGQYAAGYLDLDMDSYARDDTFTRYNHHPNITFKDDYDVFRGSTMKFLTDYDFVHADISFVGKERRQIIDLVLLLEEQGIPYSIRINSVDCSGYDELTTKYSQGFAHRLAYAAGSSMKPYQIYLIGTPTEFEQSWESEDLRSSLAFRSIALSYSRLLRPSTRFDKLDAYMPNSASIYLPTGRDCDEFIRKICDESIDAEQKYYLTRYLAEIGPDATMDIVYDCQLPRGKSIMRDRTWAFKLDHVCTYGELYYEQIGNVSMKSRPHHEEHVRQLNSPSAAIWHIRYYECDEEILMYFRTHHPIQEVRTKCNVMLGLHKFARPFLMSGHSSMEERYEELSGASPPKQSSHQRELYMAIKLLVLAARDDDYTYGMNYCHRLISQNIRSVQSVNKIIRIYRLLSYLFDTIKTAMSHGQICIRSINAISNEMEVRETTKYRYRRNQDEVNQQSIRDETLDLIIDGAIDQLFQGLERFSNSSTNLIREYPAEMELQDVLESTDLHFDIGITARIDTMIERLGLRPSGPRNIIDLGDEEIFEMDDW